MSMLLICLLIFVGCSQNELVNDNVSEQEKLVLYISGPEKMINELEVEFEKEKGDVLDIYHNGCGPITQKIWSEMEAGSIQADLIWAAEPIMYMKLQDENKLLKYESPMLKNLKKEYREISNGYFTPVNARYGVIIYNSNLVSKENVPKTFEDLTKPYFKGKVAMADARQSATALALNEGLFQIFENYNLHKALEKNEVMLTKQNVAAVEKTDSGEVYVCIAPHDAVIRLKKISEKKGIVSPLEITWPTEGAISIQRPIAIIDKETRSKEITKLAQEFVDFTLSKRVQDISTKYGFITVTEGLDMPEMVDEDAKTYTVDWNAAEENEKKLRIIYNEIYSSK